MEPNTTSSQEIHSFLESLDLPSIGEVQNKALMAEITKEEIGKAISRLKVNKAPGTDGFPTIALTIHLKEVNHHEHGVRQ